MDSILAIVLGLGLRVVLDIVGQRDIRIEGSLVGLWEGLVLFHFLQKWPKSYDPFVGFGFRIVVDFLLTEDIPRMVVVVLWTGVGFVVSDIGPVLWHSTGLRRLFRNIRRELARLDIPGFPYFAKSSSSTRVRFYSPSRASSPVIYSITPAISTGPSRPRPLPGSFPGDAETETDPSVGHFSDASSSASADEVHTHASATAPTVTLTSDFPSTSDTETTEETHSDDEADFPGPGREDRTPTNHHVLLPPATLNEIPDEIDDLYAEELLRSPPLDQLRTIPPDVGQFQAPPSPDQSSLSDLSLARNVPLPLSPPTRPVSNTITATTVERDLPVLPPLASAMTPASTSDVAAQTEASDRQLATIGRHSMAETEHPAESVISGDDPDDILQRAADLRQAAEGMDREHDNLKKSLAKAKKNRQWKDAFMLKLKMTDHLKMAGKLNERAARRFKYAQNLSSPPELLVVRHLKINEAVQAIEGKLGEMWKEDEDDLPALHVDVGPSNIGLSKGKPLKQSLIHEFNDVLHLTVTADPSDSNILIITR